MQVRQEKLMKSQNNANSYTDDVYNAIKSKELIKDVIYFDEIDSTNKFAKYNNTKDGSLIIAGYQSNGRGRLNQLWESSKDKNILITLVKEFEISNSNVHFVNFFISLMTLLTLRKITNNEKFSLKWPNDILYENKKVAGILSEVLNLENPIKKFILGIGINVNQVSFDETIKNKASSLKIISGFDFDKNNIISRLIDYITVYWEVIYNPRRLIQICRLNLAGINSKVSFKRTDNDNVEVGILKDIDDSGAIAIEYKSGKIFRHYSGEISFI